MALPKQTASAQPAGTSKVGDGGTNQGKNVEADTPEARMKRIAAYAGIGNAGPVPPHEGTSVTGIQFDPPAGGQQAPTGAAAKTQDGQNAPAGNQAGQDNAARQELEALKTKVTKYGDPEALAQTVQKMQAQIHDIEPIINAIQKDEGFYTHMLSYVKGGTPAKGTAPSTSSDPNGADADIRNVLFGMAGELNDADLDEEISVRDLFNPATKVGSVFAKVLTGVSAQSATKVTDSKIKEVSGGLASELGELKATLNTLLNETAITKLAQTSGLSPEEVKKAISTKPTAMDLLELHQYRSGAAPAQPGAAANQNQSQPGPNRVIDPSSDNLSNMNILQHSKHPGEELMEAVEALADGKGFGIKFDH